MFSTAPISHSRIRYPSSSDFSPMMRPALPTGAPDSVNRLVELLQAKDSINIPKRPGEPDCTFADMTKIREALGWSPKVGIEEGVAIMLDNIEYWRDAPVWTPGKIAAATEDWSKFLGK